MKLFFSILAACLFVSFQAHAAPQTIKSACAMQSYQTLYSAVNEYEVMKGASLKGEVLDVLSQEMGPQCYELVELSGGGIPGNKYSKYQLETGAAVYTISIVIGGVEQPGKREVYLEKAARGE